MKTCLKAGIGLAALLLCAGAALAQPAPQAGGRGGAPAGPRAAPKEPQLLHPIFADHAVLQRDRPIKLYGEAAAGTPVSVTLGSSRAETRAGADGRWSATLPAMPAGGPYALTATAGAQTSTATDILIGDVWFCTGQSNMAFAQRQAQGAANDARTATDGTIRQLTIANNGSATPLYRFAQAVNWTVGSPETVGGFSASCYYFVRELKKTANVPMGMVVAAWGGARVRNWVSEAALRRMSVYNEDLDILALSRTDQQGALRRWGAKWENWWKAARPGDGTPWTANYNDSGWRTAPAALGAWALWNGSSPDGFVGQMWLRTTVTLTAEQAAKPGAVLDLGSVNEEDATWINGMDVGASSFASRTTHMVRPGVLKEGVNVIATNIFCSWRNCGMRGPADNRAIRFGDGSSVALSNPWKYQEVSGTLIAPQMPWGVTHGLTMDYNGMVAPLGAFGFKGAIWYQGESDIYFANQYRITLKAMMDDWRRQFENPELPFLVVQLPNYGPIPDAPTASVWADVREAQRLAVQDDRRAALTVAVDIGDAADLHPTNKAELGRRLAITARSLVYGEKNNPSGPVLAGAARRGNDVVVSFTGISGRLVARSGNPNAFELCGSTQESCRWADARIEGSSVVLRNIAGATRVRHCWGEAPVCTLYDTSGLPAGPFEAVIR
jgi:sialate O-acetylesterase